MRCLFVIYNLLISLLFDMCVNYFQALQNQYMLFWLLKDALLGCKRCPLRLLLTPFWSPIKHLLFCYLVTNWYSVDCKPASYVFFAVSYRCFLWNYVMIFQILICIFSKYKKKWFSMSEDKNKIDSWQS